jgi:uncharacterized protein YrrD
MILNLKTLYGSKLAALDGEIGHVKDFYFDDKSWVIRYMVVNTGSWLKERMVLLSPQAFGKWDQLKGTLHIKLHRKQIENSPSPSAHVPVSRQFEVEYYRYYGWPADWSGDALWGSGIFPMVMHPPSAEMDKDYPRHHHRDDKHLRSAQAVKGYDIQATDGSIGHVSGFQVNDRSWAIRELVVDAGSWMTCKEIMIPPNKVDRISYEDAKVFVKLTKADIERTAESGIAKASAAGTVAEGSEPQTESSKVSGENGFHNV